MNIQLHKNATTPPARRAYIQASKASVKDLAHPLLEPFMDCSNSRYHHFTRLKKRFSLANYFQGETIRIK